MSESEIKSGFRCEGGGTDLHIPCFIRHAHMKQRITEYYVARMEHYVATATRGAFQDAFIGSHPC